MSLGPGSIAFTGFNSETDSLAFVVLQDIPAGTAITFTDNEWRGTLLNGGESTWIWTAAGAIQAGAIVTMDGLAAATTATSNLGTIAFIESAGLDISNTSDSVYAYTGSAAAPVFLTAVTHAPTGFNNAATGVLTNSGLIEGVTALNLGAVDFGADIAAYDGPTAGRLTMPEYAQLLNTPTNWVTQDANGDQTNDGQTPDLPFSTTPFTTSAAGQRIGFASASFSTGEGDGGTTLLMITLVRQGATAGTVDFSGAITLGTVDAGDFGGVAPVSFAGSFADGATTATVTIPLSGDTAYELDESFSLQLDNVANAGATAYLDPSNRVAGATIVNDDPIQFVNFAPDSVRLTQAEGDAGETKTFTFVIERTGTGGTVGDLAYSGTITLGTASDDDFAIAVPLTFSGIIPAGQASATIVLTVAGDDVLENYETFRLQLASVSNADANTLLGPQAEAVGAIANDELLIGSGQVVSIPLSVGGDDQLLIEQGAVLDVQSDEAPAISWVGGGDASVINAGVISGSTGVLGVSGASISGSLTFNNLEGALTRGTLRLGGLGEDALVTVVNAGVMTSDLDTTIRFTDAGALSRTVVNNLAGGLITHTRASTDVIRGGNNMTVNNAGIIKVVDDVTGEFGPEEYGADAVDFNSASGGVVNNLAGGVIIGSRHAVTGSKGITIFNAADAVMIGRNGSGINIDNDRITDGVVVVENHGDIEGRSATYDDSDGDAIDADGLLQLDNYGNIRGVGHNGYHNGEPNVSEGLAIGGGVVNNYAGATIYGHGRAIQVDNSENGPALAATAIYNEGLIQGDGNLPTGVTPEEAALFQARIQGAEAINLEGDWADTITNKGAIVGGIKMGGGDDVLNVHVGSSIVGAIDGGDGLDTINLLGSGQAAFGAAGGFEKLNVLGGSWTVADSAAFGDIVIGAGAAVTSQIVLSGADKLTIAEGGTVSVNESWGNAVSIVGPATDVEIDNAGTIHGGPQAAHAIGGGFDTEERTFTIMNRATGVISAEWQAAIELRSDQTSPGVGTVVLDNSGLIDGINSQAVNFKELEAGSVTIYNRAGGVITATTNADVLRPGEGRTTPIVVWNDGQIVSKAGFAFGDAIDFQGAAVSVGGTVNNGSTGLIEGSRHGITGKNEAVINNAEGGVIIGRNGSGINFDTEEGGNDTAVVVTNHGLISGRRDPNEDESDGDGVDVDYLVTLHNYGRVEGLGADNVDNFADGVAAGGGLIHNYAGGEIYGESRGILIDDSDLDDAFAATTIVNEGSIASVLDWAVRFIGDWNDTIDNSGTIASESGSAIDMGDGDDRLTNTGTISGAILLGAGEDVLVGGAGVEDVTGGAGNDDLAGGDGSDWYRYALGDGADTIGEGAGQEGDIDTLDLSSLDLATAAFAFQGDDVLVTLSDGGTVLLKDQIAAGGVENIVFAGGVTLDRSAILQVAGVMQGTDGANNLFGSAEADLIDAKGGNDYAFGRGGDDVMKGGEGADYLAGDAGNDTLDGGEGADLLFGGDGDDAIDGGAGADYLSGGNGADELAGGEGADIVYGGSGDDLVQGDGGDDLLYGDAGKDVLVGGAGNDRLSGGLDEDAFVFAAGFGKDTVTDYKIGEDITFEDGLFADFADMLASSQQLGSDVKITVDAEHNLLLKNVALASLKADDFHFQA